MSKERSTLNPVNLAQPCHPVDKRERRQGVIRHRFLKYVLLTFFKKTSSWDDNRLNILSRYKRTWEKFFVVKYIVCGLNRFLTDSLEFFNPNESLRIFAF